MKKIYLIVVFIVGLSATAVAEVNDVKYITSPVECLALNMYHEARSQGIQGKLAVGLVTLNRVVGEQWPNNICDVVKQPHQFSWTHDGKSDKPHEKEIYITILLLAQLLLDRYEFIEDITKGSTHYHATWMDTYPLWSVNLNQTVVLGDHVFYSD